jgi:hypothetical protein
MYTGAQIKFGDLLLQLFIIAKGALTFKIFFIRKYIIQQLEEKDDIKLAHN